MIIKVKIILRSRSLKNQIVVVVWIISPKCVVGFRVNAFVFAGVQLGFSIKIDYVRTKLSILVYRLIMFKVLSNSTTNEITNLRENFTQLLHAMRAFSVTVTFYINMHSSSLPLGFFFFNTRKDFTSYCTSFILINLGVVINKGDDAF